MMTAIGRWTLIENCLGGDVPLNILADDVYLLPRVDGDILTTILVRGDEEVGRTSVRGFEARGPEFEAAKGRAVCRLIRRHLERIKREP